MNTLNGECLGMSDIERNVFEELNAEFAKDPKGGITVRTEDWRAVVQHLMGLPQVNIGTIGHIDKAAAPSTGHKKAAKIGKAVGVLVENEAGRLAAVHDLGRVTWLDDCVAGPTEQTARAQGEGPSAGAVPEGLREKVNALCEAVINDDELPPTKYALRCGRLINEVRAMLTVAPTAPVESARPPKLEWRKRVQKWADFLDSLKTAPIPVFQRRTAASIKKQVDRYLEFGIGYDDEDIHPHNGEQGGEWVRCDERLPTEADADSEGNVWARVAAHNEVSALPPSIVQVFSEDGKITHWKPTGLKRPAPPTEREERGHE